MKSAHVSKSRKKESCIKLQPLSKVILPNPRYDNKRVVSWSDIVAIESGRYPQSIPPNRKMLFGTYIHKQIEEDRIPAVSPYRGTHHEVKVHHGRFVGRIDSHDDESVIDYKTCSEHWTLKMAEDHDQLRFYAYLLWKETGLLVKNYKIVSLETGWDDDELHLTGSVVVHTVPITMRDLLKVKARAERALLKLRTMSSDDVKSNG